MRPEWVIAIATGLYALFTVLIILQMCKDRRALHKPVLVARLKAGNFPDRIVFTVKNVGKGPALDCVAFCEDDKGMKWKLKRGIPPIGSNESQEIIFVTVPDQDYELEGNIRVEIRYADIFKKRHKNQVVEPIIDVARQELRGT